MKIIKYKAVLLLVTLSILYASPLVYATENDARADAISTGEEFVQWMEAHQDSGGAVSLAADITLDGMWEFVSGRAGQSYITVDTGGFSIAVSGEIRFWSGGNLEFLRPSGGKAVFYVKEGGLLSLDGVVVGKKEAACAISLDDGENHAVIQEEGAGLVVENSSVSGEICYAQTPFVIDDSRVMAIVEPGQSAEEALPSVITNSVNRNGQVFHGEDVSVSWELSGTEEMRRERRRFTVQGSFPEAASLTAPVCTVVYHDFPLTITDIKATEHTCNYMFQGGYAKSKNQTIPDQVGTEYSFDNKNWIRYGEDAAYDENAVFIIILTKEEWDVSANPYIYLRLRGSAGGAEFYSNTLRYQANHLDCPEDLEGTRGGGTAIVAPPGEPVSTPDLESNPKPGEPAADHPVQNESPVQTGQIGGEEKSNVDRSNHKVVMHKDFLSGPVPKAGEAKEIPISKDSQKSSEEAKESGKSSEEAGKGGRESELSEEGGSNFEVVGKIGNDSELAVENGESTEEAEESGTNPETDRESGRSFVTSGGGGGHAAGRAWPAVAAVLVSCMAAAFVVFARYRRVH